jgi:hypothetical protein
VFGGWRDHNAYVRRSDASRTLSGRTRSSRDAVAAAQFCDIEDQHVLLLGRGWRACARLPL